MGADHSPIKMWSCKYAKLKTKSLFISLNHRNLLINQHQYIFIIHDIECVAFHVHSF